MISRPHRNWTPGELCTPCPPSLRPWGSVMQKASQVLLHHYANVQTTCSSIFSSCHEPWWRPDFSADRDMGIVFERNSKSKHLLYSFDSCSLVLQLHWTPEMQLQPTVNATNLLFPLKWLWVSSYLNAVLVIARRRTIQINARQTFDNNKSYMVSFVAEKPFF